MVIDTKLYILRMLFSIVIYMFLFYKICLPKESPKKLNLVFLGLLTWFICSIFIGDFTELIFIVLSIIYFILIKKDIKNLNLILVFFISIKFINISSSYLIIYIHSFMKIPSDFIVYLQIIIIFIEVLLYIKIHTKFNISTYIYLFVSFSLTLLLLYVYLSIFFLTYAFKETYYFERFIELLLFFTITQGIFIAFLIFYETKVQKEIELKINNEIKFENLFAYSKLIEERNLEIQKFNHDLDNLIASITEEENNEQVNKFKKELLYLSNYTKNIPLSNNEIDTTYLKNIKNPYLRNLLLNKVEFIINKNINFRFECLEEISEIKRIHNLDLVRIIGILIDNSIEETGKIANGFINIYIHSCNDSLEFIIENNFIKKDHVSIHKLLEPGFSTKANHNGLGLNIIENIIKTNRHININYEINNINQTFRVIMIINMLLLEKE
ncbi:GHKL domain-containing protein [Mammaliicoccus sciuri]|uniref:ATP-binding protein n=2 Tax=Mammaliicoccus sciuri TaxID=1296 RepID=UPI0021D16C4E|nr:GHKL domain-containing protein [Mammaliicoccus sciuri]UXV27143.1 GHKL domain-containing protein [Mammaliicoccus sciuri]